mmetsp:Transcript_52374/g.111565  ORF Transcript_52374/g.111565 Transcript_52374/m.111565 type:complete len:356 (+) Transcript_52374:912-1979(+)
MDAFPVLVLDILFEGVNHRVEFESQVHEDPILKLEILVEGHALADVADVLDPEDVEGLERCFHCFLILFLLLLFLLLFLFLFLLLLLFITLSGGLLLGLLLLVGRLLGLLLALLLLLLSIRLHRLRFSLLLLRRPLGRQLCLLLQSGLGFLLCHLRFVISQGMMPAVQSGIPVPRLLLEPKTRSEIVDAKVKLLVADVLIEVLLTLLCVVPLVLDVVEAFVLSGHGELREVDGEHRSREILDFVAAETNLFFLRCEFRLGSFLLCLLCLCLLLLGLRLVFLRFHLGIFALLGWLISVGGSSSSGGLNLQSLLVELLSGELHLLRLVGLVEGLLFLLQQQALCMLFEVRFRGPHNN